MTGVFLTAEWRHVAMLNFAVEPALVEPLVPYGTQIDFWNGTTYLSLVGFRFLNTRVAGRTVPFHGEFEEVNLRLYVRRDDRRGVVFVKEIVPKRAVAILARALYNENYVFLPMRHRIENSLVEYGWEFSGAWNALCITTSGDPTALVAGSQEEFIAEHYWGYGRQRDGTTVEYRVEHPAWLIRKAATVRLECDFAAVYGERFAVLNGREPDSAFVAEGSAITVGWPVRI